MVRRRTAILPAVLVALAMAAGACAESADDASSSGAASEATVAEAPPEVDDGGGWTHERAGEGDAADDLYAGASGAAAELAPVAGPPSTLATSDGPVPVEAEVRPTAGSVDDNALWDEYLLYREEFFRLGLPVSDIPVAGRQLLTVVDRDGDPVLGATVTVTDAAGDEVARLRTYADGRAVFLGPTDVDPDSQSRPRLSARVERSDVVAEVDLEAGAVAQTITLDADLTAPADLDVLFLIDATGSMADEIERLKASMISVAEQISALPSSPDARFALVVYRDRGDEYVTRTFDFTGDVTAFTDGLSDVVADGGGDTPESLGAGLHDALHGPSWRDGEAVKLVFLLADAAPHLAGEPGYEDEPDYATDIRDAAATGVKVFPIASSGMDDQGEFVFRQLAQVTMGRFVFLTYGADGASPGDDTTHHVDPEDYDVLALDQLVVQLVGDELAHL